MAERDAKPEQALGLFIAIPVPDAIRERIAAAVRLAGDQAFEPAASGGSTRPACI